MTQELLDNADHVHRCAKAEDEDANKEVSWHEDHSTVTTRRSTKGRTTAGGHQRFGKPLHFRGNEAEVAMWSRKTENYILNVHTESGDLMRVAAEEPNTINLTRMKADPSTPDGEMSDVFDIGAELGWRRLGQNSCCAHRTDDPTDTSSFGRGNGKEKRDPKAKTKATEAPNQFERIRGGFGINYQIRIRFSSLRIFF